LILMEKTVHTVATFMGVLCSGNPYVPLDYTIPLARLERILENLQPKFLITDEAGQAKLDKLDLKGTEVLLYSELVKTPADEAAVSRAIDLVCDDEPIYIMYTSGSTGVPKGVVIPHRGVVDYAYWVKNTFDFQADTVLGNQAPFYFDNSVLDIYGAFAATCTLVLIPDVLFQFPNKIPGYINDTGITSVFFVPTIMINIANSGILESVPMPGLKKVLFCGEVMPNKQLNIWRKHHPNALYANLYGPTEITDVCTYFIVDQAFADADPLPIGKACENMRILIITDDNKAAKVGEIGELCVLGSALALGYWGAEEITRKVFVQNPINPYYDERMYRTGDLAFWGEDGLIHFIGRKDSQIKLRGNRIELGEIEVAVKSLPNVDNACVLLDAERQELVACVQSGEAMTLHQLKRQLLQHIPKYMLPSRLYVTEKLPLTSNDKIDRVTLKGMVQNGEI